MRSTRSSHRAAAGLAVATALFLLWLMGAVGILGVEGDPADLMYLAALAIGLVGSLAARFRAAGMACTMYATATAVALIGLVALLLGKHHAEYSSVLEIVGLTAMFALLFAASGWLFRPASGPQHPPERR